MDKRNYALRKHQIMKIGFPSWAQKEFGVGLILGLGGVPVKSLPAKVISLYGSGEIPKCTFRVRLGAACDYVVGVGGHGSGWSQRLTRSWC